MATVPYQRQHLKSLTGLRFLAALAVFVAHVPSSWPIFDLGGLPLGAAGVSFFYVLSGFILTYVYGTSEIRSAQASGLSGVRTGLGSRDGFSFKKFYVRRFARIWPLHFATLLIWLFLVMGVDAFFRREMAIPKLLVNVCLLQSWIPNYQWIYSLNGPSWSLSVEAFFYLVFPLLLLGGTRKFWRKYCLIVVGTVVSVLAINGLVVAGILRPPGESAGQWIALNALLHTNPLMRLFEFATGMGVGYLFLDRRSGMAKSRNSKWDTVYELFAAGATLGFFGTAHLLGLYQASASETIPLVFLYWLRFCGAAPVFALMVWTFSQTDGVLSKLLSCRPMVYCGEISYSLYMIHMGVMLILARQQFDESAWMIYGVVGCSFVFSMFFAAMLYQLVELPFRTVIVGLVEGEGLVRAAKTIGLAVVNWVRSPPFVPLLMVAIAAGWFLNHYRFDIHDQNRIDRIVSQTLPELLNAQFDNDATLLGVVSDPSSDHGMVIQMVWQLQEGRRPTRFIKLLDETGKVIGNGNPNRAVFDKILGNDVVIDRVEFGEDQMAGVNSIVVGFYDPVRKSAPIDRGPRSSANRHLHIWESN